MLLYYPFLLHVFCSINVNVVLIRASLPLVILPLIFSSPLGSHLSSLFLSCLIFIIFYLLASSILSCSSPFFYVIPLYSVLRPSLIPLPFLLSFTFLFLPILSFSSYVVLFPSFPSFAFPHILYYYIFHFPLSYIFLFIFLFSHIYYFFCEVFPFSTALFISSAFLPLFTSLLLLLLILFLCIGLHSLSSPSLSSPFHSNLLASFPPFLSVLLSLPCMLSSESSCLRRGSLS